ncbi:MAG: ornithine carbamoyltransferase [Armatimonadota bacterium]
MNNTISLKGRSLTSNRDFSKEEMEYLFDLAAQLKEKQKNGIEHHLLKGKTLGMIFEKSSTRTRVSFEAGMYQLGGYALYLSSSDLQLGRGETIADTAKVLSRYVDGIMARTYSHKTIEDLAKYGTVPVINGLSDLEHPCQVLCDYFTVLEKKGRLEGITLTYIGDGNNMANSLLLAGADLGVNVNIIHPGGYSPDKSIVEIAREKAKISGSVINIGSDIDEYIKNSDIIYTDVWISMGQEKETQERHEKFKAYQVNGALLAKASKDVLVMHCLPAHRGEEITDEVMDGPHSIVFDQAENRLHIQKAIMATLMEG